MRFRSGAALHPADPTLKQCLVCDMAAAYRFMVVDAKNYWRCHICRAIFLEPGQRISVEDEYDDYRRHSNTPDDQGYRRFLSKLAVPLLQRLSPRAKGLDYGCGPGPVLADMLEQAGRRMSLFDPLFYPDREVLDATYDFIACTETIEHFHYPAKEFRRLKRMLRPGGWLALMTCFQTDDSRFESWHYRRERTHVVFYREETFRHLARHWGWSCEIPVRNVVLMQKPCLHVSPACVSKK